MGHLASDLAGAGGLMASGLAGAGGMLVSSVAAGLAVNSQWFSPAAATGDFYLSVVTIIAELCLQIPPPV